MTYSSCAPLEVVHILLDLLIRFLANRNMQIQPSKSQIMCQHPQYITQPHIAGIPHTPAGIRLLGSSQTDSIEHFLGPAGLAAGPVSDRMQKAVATITRLRAMARASCRKPTTQAAWIILTRAVAHALDYDCRVSHPAAVRSHAMQLDMLVQEAAYEMVQHYSQSAGPVADTQMHLPVDMGGLAVESCTDKVWPACVAAHAKSWPHVARQFHRLTGRPPAPQTVQTCLEPAIQAQGCIAETHSTKITVTGHAASPDSKAPALDLLDLPSGGVRDVQRNTTRWIGQQRLKTLLSLCASSEADAARILSCADATAAPWCHVIPDTPDVRLDDDEFVVSVRYRLGLSVHPRGAQCHNVNKDHPGKHTGQSPPCGKVLDAAGFHASSCETGPTRYRPHTAVRDALITAARDASAEVDAEVVVPRLHQTKLDDQWHFTHALQIMPPQAAESREARLDLSLWSAASPAEMLVDVTVRNPIANRYLSHSSTQAGYTLREAKREKLRRYGAAGVRPHA